MTKTALHRTTLVARHSPRLDIARLEAKIDGLKWSLGLLTALAAAMAVRLFGAF